MLIRWGVWEARGGKGRGVTYPRSNSLVPSRTCDSTSSQYPNEVPWGDPAEAFYWSMGCDIPAYWLLQQQATRYSGGLRKRSHPVSEIVKAKQA